MDYDEKSKTFLNSMQSKNDRTMPSLVVYEDSDSETDDQMLDQGERPFVQEKNNWNVSVTTGTSSSSHENFTTSFDKTVLTSQSPSTTFLLRIQKRSSPLAHPSIQPHVQGSVRPYVPKRQRLAPEVERPGPVDAAEHIQREERSLLEVPPTLKHCLSTERAGTMGVPRRLLMSLEGHRGPVNTVCWCPVPQRSHLLLSASMDKTYKVWEAVETGRCLRVYTGHCGAVRAACWTLSGTHILTGSFDNTTVLTDVETAEPVVKLDTQFRCMCVAVHPDQPEVFLCGGFSPTVKAWDSRSAKVVREYRAAVQQTLDILFLRGATDFITSTDCVSRDSSDRTLIAWDYQNTARISNQIYHERYTCPSLALHPAEESFVAQTNGNYIALFSSQRPYRMNKRRRFEGHKVEGYAVHCDFSADGTLLASGSSTGAAHFFDYHSSHMLHSLQAHSQPCVCVRLHPALPSTAATCDWAGQIKVWTRTAASTEAMG